MTSSLLMLIYCCLIVVASFLGGWIPSVIKLTHLRIQLVMSFVSGLMIGVALLHLLPHAAIYCQSLSYIGAAILAGLLVMFFLLRIFHVHHYEDTHSLHGDDDQHGDSPRSHHHKMSWVGLFFGLAVHTFLDGIALGASVVAETAHESPGMILAFGTFLAVLLHKPLDALSITSLMRSSGWSFRDQSIINGLFAMTCPVGAFLFWMGFADVTDNSRIFIGLTLAFSAGFFLCIALSDLLPEVAFHSHDGIKLSVALLLGVVLSIVIEMMPGHIGDDHLHATSLTPASHEQ